MFFCVISSKIPDFDYLCSENNSIEAMETITIRYDATNPGLRGLMAALLALDGVSEVKASKAVKSGAKKKTKKERFLDDLTKAAKQAVEISESSPKGYTVDELMAAL